MFTLKFQARKGLAFIVILLSSLWLTACGGSSSSSNDGDKNGDNNTAPPISGCERIPHSLTTEEADFLKSICKTTDVEFAKYNDPTKKNGKLVVGTTESAWSVSVTTGWGSTVTLTNENATITDISYVAVGEQGAGDLLIENNSTHEQIKVALSPLVNATIVVRDNSCNDYFTNQQLLTFPDSDSPTCSTPAVSGDISNLFFFKGDDGEHGEELWKTDGTESGTEMVKDLVAGMGSSYPYGFLRDDDRGVVYFTAGDGDSQVWQTDGTEAGTDKIATFGNWDSAEGVLTVLNGYLYLAAYYQEGDDDTMGLFITDGTEASTQPLKITQDGNQLTIGVDAMVKHSQLYNNKLYFGAALPNKTDASESDEVLIATDGTSAGTERITVRAKHLSNTPPGGQGFAVANDKLFFNARPDATGVYMMSYDGNTMQKTPMYSGNSSLKKVTSIASPAAYKERVYFAGKHDDYGEELFAWNGGSATSDVELMKDIHQGYEDADVFGYAVFKTQLFFTARDSSANQWSLWKTDGTKAGTVEVKEPNPAVVMGSLQSYVSLKRTREINNELLFFASGENGCELWITDGETAGGTKMLKDINVGEDDGTPNQC